MLEKICSLVLYQELYHSSSAQGGSKSTTFKKSQAINMLTIAKLLTLSFSNNLKQGFVSSVDSVITGFNSGEKKCVHTYTLIPTVI